MDGARSRRAEDMIPSAFARIHRDDDDNDNSIGSRKRITVERRIFRRDKNPYPSTINKITVL